MFDWFVNNLRSYPEIAIFLSLSLGYCFGSFTYRGPGLGAVTATLISAVIIGQLGITISPALKATFLLMFLFAIGYGVGSQLVSGIAKDDVQQALFVAVICVFCLMTAYLGAIFAGNDVGSAVGLYAGSQTISASMGLATDATNRLGLPPDQTKTLLEAIPVADAVTHIFGTVGSAIVLALLGPAWDRSRGGGEKEVGGPGTAWRHYELLAYRIREGGRIVGKTCHAVDLAAPY
jgi:putative transport protein